MNQARYYDRLHFCIAWQILVLWLNRVSRKYDFKLVKYTKSNGARSVAYGWWIARLNPNTSIPSNVFLVVWHGALSWCNFLRFQYDPPCLDASSTTHACDRGEQSRTKQHTISLMWRILLIKDSNTQSNRTSIHVWHTQVRC